jgi:hypothetical protein
MFFMRRAISYQVEKADRLRLYGRLASAGFIVDSDKGSVVIERENWFAGGIYNYGDTEVIIINSNPQTRQERSAGQDLAKLLSRFR